MASAPGMAPVLCLRRLPGPVLPRARQCSSVPLAVPCARRAGWEQARKQMVGRLVHLRGRLVRLSDVSGCQAVKCLGLCMHKSRCMQMPKSGSARTPKWGSARTPKSGSAGTPKSGSARAPKSGSARTPKSGSACTLLGVRQAYRASRGFRAGPPRGRTHESGRAFRRVGLVRFTTVRLRRTSIILLAARVPVADPSYGDRLSMA